eukprot:CAMPEP_0113954752 /NCGR_PEP_ID=MMETSP0011_2-20120614/805_1 /TAXON_ID=101924 /ORGANISM="Rhodosorus marinus" /LENGTH=111 /DNA_ID=CAMNT_0000964071 /DNA_START=233 /DNA_END=569 /DNA_ORIENTATION=+ /assembly_acc=CAM_ASM_000156
MYCGADDSLGYFTLKSVAKTESSNYVSISDAYFNAMVKELSEDATTEQSSPAKEHHCKKCGRTFGRMFNLKAMKEYIVVRLRIIAGLHGARGRSDGSSRGTAMKKGHTLGT